MYTVARNASDPLLLMFKILLLLWNLQAYLISSFVFSLQLSVNVQHKFCRWLDPNRGLLELEATALPTQSQPLPKKYGND